MENVETIESTKFVYDFDFLFKLIKNIFVPVLAIVILTAIIVALYARKYKKTDIERYKYITNLWTNVLAIFVIGGLFALCIGFSMSVISSMQENDLISSNQGLYYLFLCTPFVPLLFLLVYLVRFMKTIKYRPRKKKSEENVLVEEKQEEKKIEPIKEIVKEEKEVKQKEDDDVLPIPTIVEEKQEIIEELI